MYDRLATVNNGMTKDVWLCTRRRIDVHLKRREDDTVLTKCLKFDKSALNYFKVEMQELVEGITCSKLLSPLTC